MNVKIVRLKSGEDVIANKHAANDSVGREGGGVHTVYKSRRRVTLRRPHSYAGIMCKADIFNDLTLQKRNRSLP